MKKHLIFLIIIISVVLCFAQDPVALTLKVKGEARLERKKIDSSLEEGWVLFNLDKILTKDKSYVAIKFVDGSSLVKLFPNSTMTIKTKMEENKLNKKVIIKEGTLFSKIQKKMGTYQVETPTSVASVKGTEFVVIVADNGVTDLFTLKGVVELKNKLDRTTVEIKAGEYGHATGTGSIIIRDILKGDLDKEILDELQENQSEKKMEIELENNHGEKKTIKIEFE